MATWVKKHLSSPAGSLHNPDLLGLKEKQQLIFKSLTKGECITIYLKENLNSSSKACVPAVIAKNQELNLTYVAQERLGSI